MSLIYMHICLHRIIVICLKIKNKMIMKMTQKSELDHFLALCMHQRIFWLPLGYITGQILKHSTLQKNYILSCVLHHHIQSIISVIDVHHCERNMHVASNRRGQILECKVQKV